MHLPRTCHAMFTQCNRGSTRVGRDKPQSPCTLRVKMVFVYHRSTGLTAKSLQYLAIAANIILFMVWLSNMGPRQQVCEPDEQINTEWNKAVRRTLHVPYTTHTIFLPLMVKGKPFMTQHVSRVQSFVCSSNTSVIFIGELACYSSPAALGRNCTRCQKSACLDIPDTNLLARSRCIRELLDVRDGFIDNPGLETDEVLTTIYEKCCNWFSLCICSHFKVIS